MPHTRIIFKSKGLKVIKYRVLNVHSFNAVMWQCSLWALPNNLTEWRCGELWNCFLFNDEEKLKSKGEILVLIFREYGISRTVVSVTWLESTISCYPTVLQMKPRQSVTQHLPSCLSSAGVKSTLFRDLAGNEDNSWETLLFL